MNPVKEKICLNVSNLDGGLRTNCTKREFAWYALIIKRRPDLVYHIPIFAPFASKIFFCDFSARTTWPRSECRVRNMKRCPTPNVCSSCILSKSNGTVEKAPSQISGPGRSWQVVCVSCTEAVNDLGFSLENQRFQEAPPLCRLAGRAAF